mgnify:CR=1 FL=1|jgi:hypothetical protein
MNPSRIEKFIDTKIQNLLVEGESYSVVINNLKDSIERFQKREGFIRVSKRYLLKNWTQVHFKKRYTTYYVMYSTKRLHDMEWIVKNTSKFPTYQRSKMFGLVQLKDKLSEQKLSSNIFTEINV